LSSHEPYRRSKKCLPHSGFDVPSNSLAPGNPRQRGDGLVSAAGSLCQL
jgi:hypothetical protein